MSLCVGNCCRSLFLLAWQQLKASQLTVRTSRFSFKRQLSYRATMAKEDMTRLRLPFAEQFLGPKSDKSGIVSHAAAYSSETSDLTFSNILSSSNLKRCRTFLQSKKPIENLPWLHGRNISYMKPAAVLIPLCLVDGLPSVLFTLRSNSLPTHKGEVCFPGGMVHEADAGAMNTALREFEEEIGLKKESVEVIGQMLPIPGANYEMLATPILGFCGDVNLKELKICQREVEDVFAASISSLCDKKNICYTTYKAKPMYLMPVYIGQKYRIWGMTAVMLHETLKLLAPGIYSPNIRRII